MRQAITSFLLLFTFTWAAEPKKAVAIPEVIITATRSENSASKVPAVVKTLDKKQMAERLVRTFPEALRETPGVMIQKTSNSQGSPFIRGFTGFRNLMLIDGIRFNNSTFREGPNQYWNTIDPQSLSRMEVLPSQGGTLYGSDAIGGTVNAFTKDSGYLSEAEGGFFTHGLASHRYSTAEHSNVERLETSIGEGQKWGLHAGVTLSQFGDVTDGSGRRQPHTGYDNWAFDVRLDVALDEQWNFTAVHQQARQNDAWRTHATTSGVSFAGTAVGTDRIRLFDQERSLSYVRLAGTDLNGFIDAASLTLSLQTAGEEQFRVTGGGATTFQDVDVSTLGVDLQFESLSPIGKLVYGIDYYHDWLETDGANNFAGSVADDSGYDLLGIFLQDEIDLGDRVHLFIGGRFTHVRADAGKFQARHPTTGAVVGSGSYSNEYQNFSASARFIVDLDEQDHYQLYGGVSQAFRAPNMSDLTRDDFSQSGVFEIPSPGLSPETYLTLEVGLKAQTESLTTSLGYFYTRIEDMIIRRVITAGPPITVAKANGGDGYMQGVEFAARWQIDPQWSLFGHIAWVEGQADQFIGNTTQKRREPLGKIAPLVGLAGVRWQTMDSRFWTEFVCLTYGEAGRLNAADMADTQRVPQNGTPSFWLVSLRGGCKVNEHLILTASLDNLLNETYRYHGSGSNEPGFGATLSATVVF
ncbi:MAG: TonB-dependent receptor [Verrucomicrobiota bacterium]|jgi:hemoglobin/transferrin/lactoferrin receptor protein|nr:TonB-dependent receptor [Verrucomicrobiota bacterium]